MSVLSQASARFTILRNPSSSPRGTKASHLEVEVRKKVDMAIQKIRRDALQGEADVFKWFTYMATDVMGHLSFGEGFDTLETEKVRPVAKLKISPN
jgi:hypothetical protein